MPRRTLVSLLLVLAILPLSGCLGDPLEGQAAPPFELTTTDGRTVNLSTYEGRYLVLDFMATWCVPCKLQVRHLKGIEAAYGEDVAILSIGADPTEDAEDLEAWAREHDATWDHAMDDSNVRRDYGLRIIPRLVVVDPDGRVVLARSGEVYPATLAAALGDAPSPAPTAGLAPGLLAGVALGALAPLTPFLHGRRDAWRARGAPAWGGLALGGAFLLLAASAYLLRGPVAGRATYGGLAVGALAFLGALYAPHWRRRGKEPDWPRDPASPWGAVRAAGEVAYLGLPHFALALVLGLRAPSVSGLLAPLLAFAAAAGGMLALLPRVPERYGRLLDAAGWLGLAGVGLALAVTAALG